jgi:hypothetical protein
LKKNVKQKEDSQQVTAAELRRLWKAWIKARVKEGLAKDQADTLAELLMLCKIFGLEPEDLGIARCGCGCGRIFGPTMKTIRVLTSIVLVMIEENLERPAMSSSAGAGA